MDDLEPKLPFWLNGPQAQALARAARAFWARVEGWLGDALAQADIRACSRAALETHAWGRNVERLPGEPDALFRGRVLHAVEAAVNAGSLRGLELILRAHGVTHFVIEERPIDVDWDFVLITIDTEQLSANTDLLDRIFKRWGRVCRRYVISHQSPLAVYAIPLHMDELQHIEVAA